MTRKVLFVDDEPNVLSGMRRQFGRQYELDTAEGGPAGLETIATRGPYAVVVSDMRMPGMDGAQFLALVRERSPDTVRVMLTGNNDLQTAVEAVNRGNIFRFLNKPCSPEDLTRALEAGLEQFRLLCAEKELLEKTLAGSVRVLVDMLSLVNPGAFGRASRVRRYMRHLADNLGSPDPWICELAGLLSQLGLLATPTEILEKVNARQELTPGEQTVFDDRHSAAARLLANIPRLEPVAAIIARAGASGQPGSAPDETAEQGARMLRLALEVDDRLVGGQTLPEVLAGLERPPHHHDPALLAVMQTAEVAGDEALIRLLLVRDLQPGMVFDQEIRTPTGALLVSRGQEVSAASILCLQNRVLRGGLKQPIQVIVPAALDKDGEVSHAA